MGQWGWVRRGCAALMLLTACSAGPGPPPEEPEAAPTPSPAAAPTPPPGATPSSPPAGPITLTVVGDLMLGRRVAAVHDDPTDTLRHLRPLLRRSDITVGNLESTLSTAGPPTQDDYFSAPPSVLRGLAGAGFDVLSLGNNHVGDHGPDALVETLRAFEGSGIRPVGAGRDLRTALRPAVVERGGVRVGFLAFNAIGETPRAAPGTPGALSVRMPPRTGPLHHGDLGRVLRAVRRLDRRVDVVVVLPHWGEQYTHTPWPVQSLVGRGLVDAGADLVVGGHPHWVQGVERHRGMRIYHSLGNAVFDMDFMEQTLEGVVLTATIRDARVRRVDLTPYRMDATFTPRPLRGAEGRAVLADMGVVR
ncbi:CapA family protein [Nocardioides gansuensis]|nr:CapA family protein [Nocardioides gansuensis]